MVGAAGCQNVDAGAHHWNTEELQVGAALFCAPTLYSADLGKANLLISHCKSSAKNGSGVYAEPPNIPSTARRSASVSSKLNIDKSSRMCVADRVPVKGTTPIWTRYRNRICGPV